MTAYFVIAIVAPLLLHSARYLNPSIGTEAERSLSVAGVLRNVLINPIEVLAVVLLVAFSGSRIGIGTDYYLYRQIHANINPADWSGSLASSPHEPGFTILSLLLKSVSEDLDLIVWGAACITVVLVYIAIRLFSEQPAVALFTYISFCHYSSAFNGLRQGIAVALFLLAASIACRSRRAAVVAGLSAIPFHVSAIIAGVLLLVISRVRLTPLMYLVFAPAVFLIARGLLHVDGFGVLLANLESRYQDYILSQERAGVGTYLVSAFHTGVAITAMIVGRIPSRDRWILNGYALTGPITLIGIVVVQAARAADYFSILLVLIVPYLLGRTRLMRGISLAILVVVGFGYMSLSLSNYNGLVPYRSSLWR